MSKAIMPRISLRCLNCGMQETFERDEHTPALAVEMVSRECPSCSGASFDASCEYRDQTGNAIEVRKELEQ